MSSSGDLVFALMNTEKMILAVQSASAEGNGFLRELFFFELRIRTVCKFRTQLGLEGITKMLLYDRSVRGFGGCGMLFR